MKHILLTLFFLSLPGLAVRPVWAGPGADRLQDYMHQITTLRANFTQTVTDLTGHSQQASGTLWLHRPGRFRWRYTEPSPQLIVADGKDLWLYDIELEQVIVQPVNQGLDETPALLLGGDVDLDKHFVMRELGEHDNLLWLELVPRRQDGYFKRVRLGFSKKNLLEMEVLDNFDQNTVIRFNHIERNIHLKAGLFRFTPPKGVDVVGADALGIGP